jgi:hypothetical protein
MRAGKKPSARRAGRADWNESHRQHSGTRPREYTALVRCSRPSPCPICEKPDWCSFAEDRSFAVCMRVSIGRIAETKNGGSMHSLRSVRPTSLTVPNITPSRKCIAPSDALDRAYGRLLRNLSLSPEHAANLLNRGLSNATLTRHQYKTIPFETGDVIADLAETDGYEGIPGFWFDGDGWQLNVRAGDLVIPVRNVGGQIVGIQLRSDNPTRRYRWLSSARLARGTPATAALHYALHSHVPSVGRVIVTEGVLKADVVLALMGEDVDGVIGLPGVSSRADAVEEIVRSLPKLTHALIAFDSDYRTNAAVRSALLRIVKAFVATGIRTEVITWDALAGKGLDDRLARGRA